MAKCLYCYKELNEGEKDFHKACSKKMFGTQIVPELPYTRENLTNLAKQVIRSQTTLTGVQAKLSLDINKGGRNETDRFTIVGLWGRYILKPQTDHFAHLPELEDLTMHLAELAKMQVVPHSLIRFADGELCYITRRIDRTAKGDKLPMEDMFSLYSKEQGKYLLTPAYDMLSTALVMPEDTEELALTLNGKKRKIKKEDFVTSMQASGLEEKVINNIFAKFAKVKDRWFEFIDQSFLPNEMNGAFKALIAEKLSLLA